MPELEKVKCSTPDLAVENAKKLLALFPECEGQKGEVDIDKLRQVLSSTAIEGNVERYEFTWPGKRAAKAAASASTSKTLRPCAAESVGKDGTPGGFDSENLYIEGDNLEVLKLLQTSYANQVKMIYIDPPYNTGHDFVYRDRFSLTQKELESEAGAFDEDGNRFEVNDSAEARYHSNWCSMMYPRLKLARNLLRDDGVIFLSIDDNEVMNLKRLCDEIFGEGNFCVIFPRVTKKGGKSSEATAKNHDYVLMYAKSINEADVAGVAHVDSGYDKEDEWVSSRGPYKANQTLDYDSLGYSASLDYEITIDGETFIPGGDRSLYDDRKAGKYARADWAWRWSKDLVDFGLANGFIEVHRGGERPRIYTKTYRDVKIEKDGAGYKIVPIERTKPLSTLEFTENVYSNDNAKKAFEGLMGTSVFEYTKPATLISRLGELVQGKDFTVVDFFSGSSSSADAVMQMNAGDKGTRRFIMVQLPEACVDGSEAAKAGYKTICEIAKERIRRAGKKIKEENADAAPNLDIGFRVLKLDSSSLEDTAQTVSEINQLALKYSRLKTDRSADDLLFQVLLETRLPLSEPISKAEVAGNEVFFVGGTGTGAPLVACLDARAKMTTEFFLEIAKLKPGLAFFRDDAFADDSARTNLQQAFDQFSPSTSIKVI